MVQRTYHIQSSGAIFHNVIMEVMFCPYRAYISKYRSQISIPIAKRTVGFPLANRVREIEAKSMRQSLNPCHTMSTAGTAAMN